MRPGSSLKSEQARGLPVDHRSDVFSFGIVLYQMLNHKLPFEGATGMDTLHAIMREPAPPLRDFRAEIPEDASAEIRRVLDKCLAKDPDDRYQTMKDAIVDLRRARRRLESGTVSAVSGAHIPAAAERRRSRTGADVLGAAVVLLVSAGLTYFLRPAPDRSVPTETVRPSLAVLYFENNTGDPELDWLRTALTDMLVTDLSQSPEIEVLTTDRLYSILRDMNRLDERITSFDVVQEVAQRGNVDSVLLGSFVKAGENIRISVRLQEAESGRVLTTERVEGVGESSIFPMVDDLTRRIKSRFEIPEAADAELDRDLNDVTTSSLEAYRNYAEGVNLFERGRQEDAIPFLEKAVELDPQFAMAMGKLAAIHSNIGHRKEATAYRERAFENRERLSARERYYIEGHYHWIRYDEFAQAIEAFKRAVEIYPNHGSARNNLALSYAYMERYDEAIANYKELTDRDYSFFGTYEGLAWAYFGKGDLESGGRVIREFLDRNPESGAGYRFYGDHLVRAGRLDDALAAYGKAESLDPGSGWIANGRWQVHILREEWDRAETEARKLAGNDDAFWKYLGFLHLATGELFLGRSESALAFYRRASEAYPADDPGRAGAWLGSAGLMLEKGDAAEALEVAQRAMREADTTVDRYWGIYLSAVALAELNRWEEADRAAEEIRGLIETIPSERWKRTYGHLTGIFSFFRGDAPKAIETLTPASALLPARAAPHFLGSDEHATLWFDLASAHMANGDPEEAEKWFQRVAESTTEHYLLAHSIRAESLLPGKDSRATGRDGPGARVLPAVRGSLGRRRSRSGVDRRSTEQVDELRSLALGFFDCPGQRGQVLEEIPHHAHVGDAEDRGVGIFINSDDVARALHAHDVLDRPGDARRHVELGTDGHAAAPNLMLVR
jgi:tetratricopeptide (TPR) repeat protein